MALRRTPIKRKTPLRAKKPMFPKTTSGTPKAPKPRKRMKPVSAKKASWNRRYSGALQKAREDQVIQRGHTYCQRCEQNCDPDGHHPGGQNGARILVFVLVCRPCHDWIHANGEQAREDGWLE